MTNYVKRLTTTLEKMTNLYGKLKDFKNFEDLEELSNLMGTNDKIDSVIKWVLSAPTENVEWSPSIKVDDVVPAAITPTAAEAINKSIDKFVDEPTTSVKLDLSKFIGKIDKVLAKEAPEVLEKEKENQRRKEATITFNGEPITPEFDINDPSNDGFIETAPTSESYDFCDDIMKKIMMSYINKDWLKLYNGEWRRNNLYPIMQSKTGLFWDLVRNTPCEMKWMSGDLRVNVNPPGFSEDHKLCGTMMCAMWHLKRPYDYNENFVFTVKDGDRRNLNIENLTYENKTVQLSPTVRLLHDICQRAVACNFVITKILSYYENSSPSVSPRWISDIIYKRDASSVSISDAYFKLIDGKPTTSVSDKPSKPSAHHSDIVGTFRQVKEPKICAMLFMDKIAGGYDLTHQEKELLVNIAKYDLPPEKRFNTEIATKIEQKFGWKMSKEEVKGFLVHPGIISKEYATIAISKGGAVL